MLSFWSMSRAGPRRCSEGWSTSPIEIKKVEGARLIQHEGGSEVTLLLYWKGAYKQEGGQRFTWFNNNNTRGDGFLLREHLGEVLGRNTSLTGWCGAGTAALSCGCPIPGGAWGQVELVAAHQLTAGLGTGSVLRSLPT